VLTVLRDSGTPMTLGDLTAAIGLHPNTLREHLDALVTAGLVRRRQGPASGPGRPPTLYETSPGDSAGAAEYAGLAGALAAMIHRTSEDPGRDALDAGERWGRELAADHGRPARSGDAAARREVIALLDDLGFAPETDREAARVRLRQCPLLDTARRYPDVVCSVHLGIVRGALDEYDADSTATELHPFAEPGACRLHLARSAGGRR
jgi:predicted ArsR family transcriptional regulator